jgi:hypothetical protein
VPNDQRLPQRANHPPRWRGRTALVRDTTNHARASRREVIEDDTYHFLCVPEGKDTTGNGSKSRDAYLLRSVERNLHRYQRAEDIGDEDPYINLTHRSVQRTVKDVTERTADRTQRRLPENLIARPSVVLRLHLLG